MSLLFSLSPLLSVGLREHASQGLLHELTLSRLKRRVGLRDELHGLLHVSEHEKVHVSRCAVVHLHLFPEEVHEGPGR
jgi:hypothetical protein